MPITFFIMSYMFIAELEAPFIRFKCGEKHTDLLWYAKLGAKLSKKNDIIASNVQK